MNGPEKSYCTLMDDVVAKRAKEQPKYNPLRPSAAGYPAKKLAYDLMVFLGKMPPPEDKMPPNVRRLLGLGHYVEEHIIDDLKEVEGFTTRYNQQVVEIFTLKNGQVIEGSTDIIMWSEKHRCVLDAKTVGDRWHSHFKSKWSGFEEKYSLMESAAKFDDHAWYVEDLSAFLEELDIDDPLYKNLVQVNLYCCSKFMRERGIDHGVVLRYNKNNSLLMEIRFKPSLEEFFKAEAKFNSIIEAVENNCVDSMACGCVLGSQTAAFCPYRERCFPNASKRDIYQFSPPRKWAKRMMELELGDEIERLFQERDERLKVQGDIKKIELKILSLLSGHGVSKVKRKNNEVYEVKQLAREVSLRRSKE